MGPSHGCDGCDMYKIHLSKAMNYKDFMATPQRACAIVVHRGIWRDAPENSLLAIERAIEGGYDVVEIDVRRSADGEFFLLHDATLERMAGIAAALEDLTAAELTGIRLRNRDGSPDNEPTNQKLPSLRQVFELTRGRIFIHLDVKNRTLIPEIIALAKSMGVGDEVDVWSVLRNDSDFDWISRAVMAEDIAFIAKTHLNVADAARQIQLVFDLRPAICEIYFEDVAQLAEHKRRFAEAGIALWVNTLDDVSCAGLTDTAALKAPDSVWGRLLDAGVSAIQTDEAEALRAYLLCRP